MDLARTEDLFPQPNAEAFFNSAGSTLVPAPVHREASEFLEMLFRDPIKAHSEAQLRVRQLRENLGRMMGAAPDEVAITHHTAEGANVVANGIAWKMGDTILTLDREYPSTIYPWISIQRRMGVRLVLLEERGGRVEEEEIVEAIKRERPRLVALSAVEWCSGYRFDIDTIGQACEGVGAFFFVDAAQALGITEIDVKRAHVSAMAGSAWKWLFGPHGQGYLYLHRELFGRIAPVFVGSESVIHHQDYLDYDLTFRPDMGRFEYSTANLAAIAWFDAGVRFVAEVGRDNILPHVMYLQDYTAMLLREKGCEIRGDGPESTRSGIMAFRHPLADSRSLSRSLFKKEGIVTRERDGFVRLSFHIYNTREGIGRLMEALERLLP